ncbi:MAG: hypothetical protein KJ070_17170, partial [Verrucomicrobia bacterium]|nr:hypothetical protein [Verrucomicrobiota bacterium]
MFRGSHHREWPEWQASQRAGTAGIDAGVGAEAWTVQRHLCWARATPSAWSWCSCVTSTPSIDSGAT